MRVFVRILKKANNLVDDEMQMAAAPETGQDQISDLASGRVSNQEISIAFQQRFRMRARDWSVVPKPTINF
jgi:hypothetical protein